MNNILKDKSLLVAKKMADLDNKYEELERLQLQVLDEKDAAAKECNHKFIVYPIHTKENDLAYCLCCGRAHKLDYINSIKYGINVEEALYELGIELDNYYVYNRLFYIVYENAKNKLRELIEKDENIKNDILYEKINESVFKTLETFDYNFSPLDMQLKGR